MYFFMFARPTGENFEKKNKKYEKSIDKDCPRWYNNRESKAEVHFSPASNGVCTVNTCNVCL